MTQAQIQEEIEALEQFMAVCAYGSTEIHKLEILKRELISREE